jgi:hypothetical protein
MRDLDSTLQNSSSSRIRGPIQCGIESWFAEAHKPDCFDSRPRGSSQQPESGMGPRIREDDTKGLSRTALGVRRVTKRSRLATPFDQLSRPSFWSASPVTR